MIKFVEAKSLDITHVANLLEICAERNHWANRGPLYAMLAERYADHFDLEADRAVTPCANGGIALEAMSRLLGQRAGRPLRWIGSAFSFQNLGRGHFADMTFVDCTAQGLLDLDQVRALPQDGFDGLIVVNPFGLFNDFSAYFDYARASGKALLIDNAAGVNDRIPEWPWQAFSLHHTKPYGMGEGGLAVTPADAAEDFYALLDYGTLPGRPSDWLNNGKLSDIACAFLVDRLDKIDNWSPAYHEQAERVHGIAQSFGLTPIRPFGMTAPATSWAFTAEAEIPLRCIHTARHLHFAKYYKPLRKLSMAQGLFDRLINIPTHRDVGRLGDAALREDLDRILADAAQAPAFELDRT
jgi:dTDP-4-amino-4,6-dideoxygalactose transaminase